MAVHSDIPFENRAAYRDCAGAWCMNERGEHGKIIDWQDTRYWGERRVVVRWFRDGSLTQSYCDSVSDESRLIPLDISKDWGKAVEQQKTAFAAMEEKARLAFHLQKVTEEKPNKRL